MDVIHNLTGNRFGHRVLVDIGLNQVQEHKYGTEGRNRTGTPVKEPDFESGASTSSATPARYAARIVSESRSLIYCYFQAICTQCLFFHHNWSTAIATRRKSPSVMYPFIINVEEMS